MCYLYSVSQARPRARSLDRAYLIIANDFPFDKAELYSFIIPPFPPFDDETCSFMLSRPGHPVPFRRHFSAHQYTITNELDSRCGRTYDIKSDSSNRFVFLRFFFGHNLPPAFELHKYPESFPFVLVPMQNAAGSTGSTPEPDRTQGPEPGRG